MITAFFPLNLVSVEAQIAFTVKTTEDGLGHNRVRSIFVDESIVYLGTDGGVSISTDGGATFTNRTTADGLPSNVVYSVFGNGTDVYAGTTKGFAISTDGGTTFTSQTTIDGLGDIVINDIYVVEGTTCGNTIYAATNGNGLGVSTDGGQTFTTKTTADGLGMDNVQKVIVIGDNWYVGTNEGMSISKDGGVTFVNVVTATGQPFHRLIRSVFIDGSTIYAGTNFGGMSVSTDEGITYTNKTTADGLASNAIYGIYKNGNNMYTAASQGTHGFSTSTDGGNSFDRHTTPHEKTRDLFVSGKTIYLATDAGLAMYEDSNLPSTARSMPAVPSSSLGISEITVDEMTIGRDFGFMTTGASMTKTYTITNDGTGDLEVSSISSSNPDFAIVGFTSGSITSNNNASFDVVLTPSAMGGLNSTISINSNDCDESNYSFQVNGSRYGESLNFQADDDYITTNDDVDITNQSFTIEFWSKRHSADNNDYIIAQGTSGDNGQLHIGYRPSNEFTFAFHGNDLNVPTTYSDSEWHHWACVYEQGVTGTDRYIYRDGVLVASDNSSTDYSGTGSLYIGKTSWNPNSFYGFEGILDELRVWNYARSAIEINDNISCGLEGTESGLLLYYPFNQGIADGNNGTETTVIDESGNSNDGTMEGFSLYPESDYSNWTFPGKVIPVNISFDTDNATQSTTATGMYLYNVDVCGDLTGFTNNFTSSGGFASFQLYPSSNSNCQQVQITYAGGVEWAFTASSANGCDAIISDDDVVAVGGAPLLVFGGFTVTPETCPNDLDGALDISVTGGDTSCGDYIFSWTGSNGFTSTSQNLTGIASGYYDVTITDCAGTSIEDDIYVNRTNSGNGRRGGRGGCKTALEQLVLDFRLQPNPAKDFVQISFEVEEGIQDFNISLIDLAGRTLQETSIEGDGMVSLDISEVPNGMYIVQLQSNNQVIRQEKLVVVK
ncbi:MAG: LamG-like jellyroll fold domain-containing protein [Chitinophagales bacterium]